MGSRGDTEDVALTFFGGRAILVRQALTALNAKGLRDEFLAEVGKGGPMVDKMAELYRTLGPLTEEHKVAIREWADKMAETDHPFDEPRTYYAIDAESSHRRFVHELQSSTSLKTLFESGEHNAAAREACELLLTYFHLLYVHESVWRCCQPALSQLNRKGHPVAGLKETLPALTLGSGWICWGNFLDRMQFAKDPSVQAMCAIARRVPDPCQLSLVNLFFENQGKAMLEASRKALQDIHTRLKALTYAG